MSIVVSRHHAVLFDNDGVVTNTAHLHFMGFFKAFDLYFQNMSTEERRLYQPFTKKDFRDLVDGKPRYAGVDSFLKSRGITLPFGSPDDPPGIETVCQLGNLKAKCFVELLEKNGPCVYEGSLTLIKKLRALGVQTAVVSSSKNCERVLWLAKIGDLFDVRIDGVNAEELKLRGKPEPDYFLAAGKLLGVSPENAVVIEDAVSGVASGIAGDFGLVIGVNRGNCRQKLLEAGAHIVVEDLSELNVVNLPTTPHTHSKL